MTGIPQFLWNERADVLHIVCVGAGPLMHNGGGVIEARDESMVTSSSNPLSPLPGPSVRLESQSRLRCVGSIMEPPPDARWRI